MEEARQRLTARRKFQVYLETRAPGARLAAEQADQRIEIRREQVLPAQVRDDALLVLAVLSVRFDQAHVLVLDALAVYE